MQMNYMLIVPVASMCIASGLLFGCTPSEEEESGDRFSWVLEQGGEFPDVDPLQVTGDIQIAGSSTVFPLAETMAARFNDEGYGFSVTIDSIGSGGGFERFCLDGTSDISNASRPINNSEREACQAIGREPIELLLGIDALAIAVNPRNTWASELTEQELAQVFIAEQWSDINSAWPNEAIERFVPGTDSGTFDYFIEEVFDGESAPLLATENTQFSEDDNVLVQGISGSHYSIGFFGYAYVANNADALKVLRIEGVEPMSQSVEDGSYPLSRPLFMYSDASIIEKRPQVGAFLVYMLNYVHEEIGEVGYFPAGQLNADQAKSSLAAVLRDLGAVGQQ